MVWHDEYRVWLTESQSLDNAQMVVNHLFGNSDWSRESICALVGNMRIESSVNPNMYEYGYDWSADRGFGLVQWTPRSKYWDWAVAQGLQPREGNSQLDRIDYEVTNNIQWIAISDYGNMTFTDFRTNSGNWSIDYLTEAFTWSYERPAQSAGQESMPDRKAFANLADTSIDWSGGGGTTPPPGDGSGTTGKLKYIEVNGDILYLKFDGRAGKVPAYPTGSGRWIPAPYDTGSGSNPPDDGGSAEFVSPAQGTFTSDYGPRSGLPWHAGVDIANNIGTPIYAPFDGEIIGVGANLAPDRSGDRNVLMSVSNGWNTGACYFGHCASYNVSVGQVVTAGEKIAEMGARGNVTGPHLHFETWSTTDPGTHFDPETVFNHYGIAVGAAPAA